MFNEETREVWAPEAVDPDEPEEGGYERDADGLREFLGREMRVTTPFAR